MLKKIFKVIYFHIVILLLSACATSNMKPIPLVNKVDLNKFMGDWYVIAAIPTAIEKEFLTPLKITN